MLFNKQNLLNLNQNVASLATPVSIRVKALPSRGDFDTYLSSADTEGGNASFDRRIGGFTNLPVTESSDNRLLRYRNSMKVGWENYESEIQGTESTAIFKGLLQYHPTDDIFSYVGNRPFNVQRATLTLTTKNKKPVTGTFQVEYMKNDPVISESATWESPSPETGARWFSPTVAAGSTASQYAVSFPGVQTTIKEDTNATHDFSEPQFVAENPCMTPSPSNPNHPLHGKRCFGIGNGSPVYVKPGCSPCQTIPSVFSTSGGDTLEGDSTFCLGPKRIPLHPPPIFTVNPDGTTTDVKPYAVDPESGCEFYSWGGNIWRRCPGRQPEWSIGHKEDVDSDGYPPPPSPPTIVPGAFDELNSDFTSSSKIIKWDDYEPCWGIPLCPKYWVGGPNSEGEDSDNPSSGGSSSGDNNRNGSCTKLSQQNDPWFECEQEWENGDCKKCRTVVWGEHGKPRGINPTPSERWRNRGSDGYGPNDTGKDYDFCHPIGGYPCLPIGTINDGQGGKKIILDPNDSLNGSEPLQIGDCTYQGYPVLTRCCPDPNGVEGALLCAVIRDFTRTIKSVRNPTPAGYIHVLGDCPCNEDGPGCKDDPDPYGTDGGEDGPIVVPQPEILNEDTSDGGSGTGGSTPGTGFTDGLNTGTTDSRGYYSSLLSTTTVKNSSTVQFDITKLVAQWANDPNKPLSFTVRYSEEDYFSETFEFNTMEASVLPIGDGVYTTCRFLTGGETTDIKTAGIRSILEQTDNGVKITVVENDLTSQTAFNSFASLVGTGETFEFVDPDTNNNINIGAATCTMLSRPSNNSIIVAGISLPNGVESHETTVDMSATSVEIPAEVYILDINTPTKKTLNAFAALSAGDAISVNYSAASTTNNAKEFTIKSVSDETLFHNRLRVYLNETVVSEDRRNKPTQIDEAGIRPSLSIDLLIE